MARNDEPFEDALSRGTDELVKAIVDSMREEADVLRPSEGTVRLLLTTNREVLVWCDDDVELSQPKERELDEIIGRNTVVLGSLAGVAAFALNRLQELGVEPKFPEHLEPPDFPPPL